MSVATVARHATRPENFGGLSSNSDVRVADQIPSAPT